MDKLLKCIFSLVVFFSAISDGYSFDPSTVNLIVAPDGKIAVDIKSDFISYLNSEMNYALFPSIKSEDGHYYSYKVQGGILDANVTYIDMKKDVIKSLYLSLKVKIGFYYGGGIPISSGDGICNAYITYPFGRTGSPIIECEPTEPLEMPVWPE